MSTAVRVIAWARPDQELLIEDAVREGALELAAVGSPEAGAAIELGRALDSSVEVTLRSAILRNDVDVLWLASADQVEPDELKLLRETSVTAISTEPMPGSLPGETRTSGLVRFVPLMRHSPGYRAAGQVLDQFGERHGAAVIMGCAAGEGTLFARLFDAMDVLEALCGTILHLDAALWRPLGGVPETLRGLRGHLTLNARFPDNRCASATVTDGAGRWMRRLLVLGETGSLHIDDAGFEWISPQGKTLDSHRETGAMSPGRLVAAQLRRWLDNTEPADPPPDAARLLALCEAARLSARTGGSESPGKVLDMLRRP